MKKYVILLVLIVMMCGLSYGIAARVCTWWLDTFILNEINKPYAVNAVEVLPHKGIVRAQSLFIRHDERLFGTDMLFSIGFILLDVSYPESWHQKKLYCTLLDVSVDEIVLVRNEQGVLNIEGIPAYDMTRPSKKEACFFEVVRLTLKKVVYVDYATYGKRDEYVLEKPVKMYRNVRSPKWVPQAILYRILAETPFARHIPLKKTHLKPALQAMMDISYAQK